MIVNGVIHIDGRQPRVGVDVIFGGVPLEFYAFQRIAAAERALVDIFYRRGDDDFGKLGLAAQR